MNNSVHFFINMKCIFISLKYRDMYRIVTQVWWYGSYCEKVVSLHSYWWSMLNLVLL